MKYEKYEDVPWYRRNLTFILTALFFSPACLLIMWTGEVYWMKKGVITVYSKAQKIALTIILGGLLLGGIINLCSTPSIATQSIPIVTQILKENIGEGSAECVNVKIKEKFAPNNWRAVAILSNGNELKITVQYKPDSNQIQVSIPNEQ